LNQLLQGGTTDEEFLQRIVNAFHPDPDELERAITDSDELQQREHDETVRQACGTIAETRPMASDS
jgi:hypothetical protein